MKTLRRLGWTSLLVWAVIGLALESANGLKLAPYLDDALARELLTLAHAHGVGLAIVTLLIAEHGLPRVAEGRHAVVVRATAFAALAIPLGFALAAPGHPEGDPGLPIWIVPVGALALLSALATITHAVWTRE
jgi:hypothetical protein